MNIKTTEDIIWKAVDDEILLLDTASAYYFSLNETGSEIWKLLNDGKDADEIADVLCERYDADRSTICSDIAELLRELQSQNILVSAND